MTLEITTSSLMPGAALLLLIFPDGFHFSADPEPVLTHRNTGSPSTPNAQPETLNPQPETLNPEPVLTHRNTGAKTPEPSTLDPRPSTLNP